MDPAEQDGSKALARMLHVDDEERYAHWTRFLDGEPIESDIATREGRLNLMLFAALATRTTGHEVTTTLTEFRERPALRVELSQLWRCFGISPVRDWPDRPKGLVPLPQSRDVCPVRMIAAYGLIARGYSDKPVRDWPGPRSIGPTCSS